MRAGQLSNPAFVKLLRPFVVTSWHGIAATDMPADVKEIFDSAEIPKRSNVFMFALDQQGSGANGALLQAVNHGLVVAPMFLIIVLLAERSGTEDITKMGGLAFRAPVWAALFLIVALATLAMPGASNFVGEFLILLGLFQTKLAIALIAFTGVVMASVYMLRMFIRTMHNRVGEGVTPREIGFGDAVVIVPLVLAILAFALYPQAALTASEPAVKSAVEEVVR